MREDGSKVYYLQNSAKSGEPGRACDETAPSKLSAAFFVTDEDGVITGYDEIGGEPVANYEPMYADLFSPLKDER